jgi:hypothetical protein
MTQVRVGRILMAAGAVALALGGVLDGPASAAAGASAQLTATPSAGPIGTQVQIAGTIDCADIVAGQNVVLQIRQLATVPEATRLLGEFPAGAADTISATVTIPPTLSLVDEGGEVATVDGGYVIEAACAPTVGTTFHGGAPFTVGPVVATTSTTSTTVASTATTSTTSAAPTTGAGTVVPASGKPGSAVTFAAAGFAPGSSVAVTFESTPVALATLTANAGGAVFAAGIATPRNAGPGAHQIVARGVSASGTAHEVRAAFTAEDLDCLVDFTTRAEARVVLNADPTDPHVLDRDKDGIPCEELPEGTSGTGGGADRAIARTGAEVLPLTGIALLLIGMGLVLVQRRTTDPT